MTHPILYTKDSKGRIRQWQMEVDGDRYRTTSGLVDGKKVTTEWTTAISKNDGRSNAKTAAEQAEAEVIAQYAKKRKTKYHDDLSTVDNALFFNPMLAQTWDKRRGKIDWSQSVFYQPKLDGIRCIATRSGLWTRTGKPITAVPHVWEYLVPVFEVFPDAIIDGELYNNELSDDFNAIVSMVRKQKPSADDLQTSRRLVQYHVYDCPSVDGTFLERYTHLRELVQAGSRNNSDITMHDVVQLVPTIQVASEQECDDQYAKDVGDGYEGGMIRLNGPYEQKRSNNLIKRKDFQDDEFTIVRIEEGNGNWSGVAKSVVFANDRDGREVGAGLKGSKDYAKHVLDNKDMYIGKQVTVRYFTRTPDGIPRFPIAVHLHEDTRW